MKMKKKESRENGITLISLVITIIILIILAGIAITQLMGNGLLGNAKEAKKQAEISSIKEQIQTEIFAKQIENRGSISDESLEQILEKYGTLSKEEKLLDKTITTTKGKYEIKVSEIFNGTTVKDEQKKPTFTTVANAPDIDGFDKTKTYYVEWNLNETGTEYIPNEVNMKDVEEQKNTIPNNWYNYTQGKNQWANIKTTGGGNDCYWVWIPRYAYKVPNRNSGGETIDIKFLQNDSNIPIGETEAITNTTPTQGTWVVHPAFTSEGNGGFGELSGIWVAKFEASSSNVNENTINEDLNTNGGGDDTNLKVRVKPNVTSWRGITVGSIFQVCRNMTNSGNSLDGTINLDSHMMKNTEWGAVAYLSRSIYGKNSKVWINPYYNNESDYSTITGLCAKEESEENLSTTNVNDTCKYNEIIGENASTTGNVYGVYDMVGGSWEITAGILSDYKSSSGDYDFNNSSIYPNKYFDWYVGDSSDGNTNYNANTDKYGDAVYETSISGEGYTGSWDSTYSKFPFSDGPVITRGGHALNGGYSSSNSGIFAFSNMAARLYSRYGFRPVVLNS